MWLLKYISLFSKISFDSAKLNFIVRWIFHSPDVLILPIKSREYVLIFWMYCSIAFYHLFFYIQYTYHQSSLQSFLVCSLCVGCYLFRFKQLHDSLFDVLTYFFQTQECDQLTYHIIHQVFSDKCPFSAVLLFPHSSMLIGLVWVYFDRS